MKVGGLQKHSLIDFPGMLCCVVFLAGCNFRCPYCHNPALVNPEKKNQMPWQEKDLMVFLNQRKGFLDGVVISGGEPTLQPDLASFCRAVKKMGYAIKLDTNGSRPLVLEQLIGHGLLDYIAMDIKTDPDKYSPHIWKHASADTIQRSVQVIMQSKLPYEFRTTCAKPFVSQADFEAMTRLIEGARLYVLQRFKKKAVLTPSFFENRDGACSDVEMHQLQKAAALRVASCIIR